MTIATGALSVANLKHLIKHLWLASKDGRYCPLLVWGESGIGKSQSVSDTARELGIGFKDLRLGLFEAPDLLGVPRQQEVFPCFLDFEGANAMRYRGRRYTRHGLWNRLRDVYQDKIPGELANNPDALVDWAIAQAKRRGLGALITVKTVNSPPSWLPQPGTAGLLFLDEINRSQRDVRNGAFQLLLERQVGETELPRRWVIVSAINPPSTADEEGRGGYDVESMEDKAFLSRFCHVGLAPSVPEWLSYARSKLVDPRIRAFVSQRGLPALGSSRPTEIPDPEPTPRSWVLLSRVISDVPSEVPRQPPYKLDSDLVAPVAVGLVGVTATRVWFSMRSVPDRVVEFSDIMADPADALRRLKLFLAYPVYDPESGEPITGSDGEPLVVRRSDLIRVAFESAQNMVNEMKGQQNKDFNVIAHILLLLQWGFQSEEEGGLGHSDIAYNYLKGWNATVGKAMLPKERLPPADADRLDSLGVDTAALLNRLRDMATMRGKALRGSQ